MSSARVMIITGAGSGIGAATAIACAEDGMNLVLNGRRVEPLERVAERIRGLGRAAEIVAGDVTSPGMSARLLDCAEQRFGGFCAVFANAGYGFLKPMHVTDLAALREIFEVNFFAGVDLLTQAARRLIATDRMGHLMMCSSGLAKFTLAQYAAYSATKAAQNHICRAMRLELRPYGIEVASVHPVTTRTEFFAESARRSGLQESWADDFGGAPAWLVQPAERVARAVVKCLHRPTPEVWTSHSARIAAGVFTMFPGLLDRLMRERVPAPAPGRDETA